jgi:hypothetical protein
MKTLSILAATAMFALATPVEAAALVAVGPTVADECPPGFVLGFDFKGGLYPTGTIVVGPGDLNGDGLVCKMAVMNVIIVIDNRP